MTYTEHVQRQQQADHARKVEARRRNAEIQEIFKRRALYGDHNPTRPLTRADSRRITLRRLWNAFAAKFSKGEL